MAPLSSDWRASATYAAGAITGTWSEATRNAAGTISGKADGDRFYVVTKVKLVSLPAGSVPAGMTSDGLPVGLQIVAPRFEETRILSLAKIVQQMNPIGWPPQ